MNIFLGSILILSATETTIVSGLALLSFYSLGLAIPFILSGYYMTVFLNSKKGFGKHFLKIKIGVILTLKFENMNLKSEKRRMKIELRFSKF